MFALSQPLGELILTGTLGFLGLLALVRIVPKRNSSHISPQDMLILVVVGTLGSHAIADGTTALEDLLILIALVLILGYLLDWLEFNVPWFRRLMRHEETALVKDGKLLRRNMRRELVTEEELMSSLRQQGIFDLKQVECALIEPDGEISVRARDGKGP